MSETDDGGRLTTDDGRGVAPDDLAAALRVIGLEFTPDQLALMMDQVTKNRAAYEALRAVPLDNAIPPALAFSPAPMSEAAPSPEVRARRPMTEINAPEVEASDDLEAVAFWPVSHLAHLIRTQQVASLDLTKMYLARLERIGPRLACVVTLTEDLALEQAARADAEIAAGNYRGPLHGIPWGAKDLLATEDIPTTWGATPYRNQIIESDATVVKRLADAGAVLVAKLSMGALAWGDVWFGGMTRSPWKLDEGSSGSSAGSGAAVAAGLVGFAIGTETHGSIVSPSTRCGVSGLRPTFGRVSRAGAMALSWSMDKIGPMCRSVEDCAHVFDAIRGPDGLDPTVVSEPFAWPMDVDLSALKFGYTKAAFETERDHRENDDAVLQTLRKLGATLVPIELPDFPDDALHIILTAEAAAAFDELTRSGRADQLVRQDEDAWPNRLRAARLIPAVEYVQANRVRTLIMQQMAALMADVDLYVTPTWESHNLLTTNLTGHPAVVVPTGVGDNGMPTSITFIGRLYDEATILAVASQYQTATGFHTRTPTGLLDD